MRRNIYFHFNFATFCEAFRFYIAEAMLLRQLWDLSSLFSFLADVFQSRGYLA